MSEQKKHWWLLPVVAGVVIALDQVAKWLTVENLALGQTWDPIPWLSPFIRVMYSQNTGAAFGMFPTAAPIFLVVAVIAVVVFVVLYAQMPPGAWLSRISVSLIVGGAASNAIDRIRHGYVVDYFHIKLWGSYSNISNFADHAIFFGTIILLISQWMVERAAQEEEEAQAEEAGIDEPEMDEPERLASLVTHHEE